MQRRKWKITQLYRDNIQKTTARGYFAIRGYFAWDWGYFAWAPNTPLPFPGGFETYFVFKNNFLAKKTAWPFFKMFDFLGVIVVWKQEVFS